MSSENIINEPLRRGTPEYNRNAQRKHYYEHNGKEKCRLRYYERKYGKEYVSNYQKIYGDNCIPMLKIEILKRKMSDSSSDSGSSDDNDNIIL